MTQTPHFPTPVVWLHAPQLHRIGQVTTAQGVSRSFGIMGEARTGQFTVSEDERLLTELIQPARVVVIESDAFPQPWAGIVSRVRANPRGGTVTVTCRSYEAKLEHRQVGDFANLNASAGEAMREILSRANATGDLRIVPGRLSSALGGFEGSLANMDALSAMGRVAEAVGAEWWLDMHADASGLRMALSAAPFRGSDLSRSLTLVDGGAMHVEDWSIDGEAADQVTVIGGPQHAVQPPNATPRSRASVRTSSAALVHGYSPVLLDSLDEGTERQVYVEHLRTQGAVDLAAQVALGRALLGISRTMTISGVLSHPGVDWSTIQPGSVVGIEAPRAFVHGHRGPARILGMQPDETNDEVGLVVQLLRGRG